jgi:hypothetical protein
MLGMPYLELFSPDGHSLYRGENALQNASFLRELQHTVPIRGNVMTSEWHPSLHDYFDLVASLKPYESRMLADKHFTLLAVTYPDRPFCQPENDALQQFASQPNIQIVVIRLHS